MSCVACHLSHVTNTNSHIHGHFIFHFNFNGATSLALLYPGHCRFCENQALGEFTQSGNSRIKGMRELLTDMSWFRIPNFPRH